MKPAEKTKLKKVINKFRGKKILVVGDLMIDEYMWGDVSRISPEAPIPVVEVSREETKPGGAANVILNLIDLGAKVYCAGIVGADANAHKLIRYFKAHGVNADAVIEDRKRPTTVKTRIFAHSQQVVRIDKEKIIPIDYRTIAKILKKTDSFIKKIDAVIFSDYSKGMLTGELVTAITQKAKGKIITVDPKPKNINIFRNVTLISPNKNEASKASGIHIETQNDLVYAGRTLKDMINCEVVLITRGEEGMSLFDKDGIHHIPTVAKEVYDVTGAGDTVISVATLALCAGASFVDAAVLSNIAAGMVVAEVGVVTVSPKELADAVNAQK